MAGTDARQLVGRVAVITGGTRGIGRAITEAFLANGARVMISGRSRAKGEQALAELDAGEDVAFRQCDVTNQRDVEELIDATVMHFGALDVVVLNAGGARDPRPIVDMTDEEWELEVAWNLHHTFWGLRRSLRHMIENGSGRVITMSSVEGKHGRGGIAGYVAMKHAINGLTKSAAHEVGRFGITVNALCPGLVLTDAAFERADQGQGAATLNVMVERYSGQAALGRPVTAQEVAAVAVLLASDKGSGITGALISVDGGTAAY